MRKIIATLLVGAAVAGGLIACGGDDNNGGGTTMNPDSGMTMLPDGNMIVNTPDSSMNTGDSSMMMTDGGSGCAFTDFVIDQVKNNTSGQMAPADITGLDPACANSGSPTQFSSLFP